MSEFDDVLSEWEKLARDGFDTASEKVKTGLQGAWDSASDEEKDAVEYVLRRLTEIEARSRFGETANAREAAILKSALADIEAIGAIEAHTVQSTILSALGDFAQGAADVAGSFLAGFVKSFAEEQLDSFDLGL